MKTIKLSGNWIKLVIESPEDWSEAINSYPCISTIRFPPLPEIVRMIFNIDTKKELVIGPYIITAEDPSTGWHLSQCVLEKDRRIIEGLDKC